jgi:hypothetical protein
MNTIYVGKLLLKILNEERGESVDAHTFFEKDFWPVMFNSPDSSHLMQVHSSDFFQPSYPQLAEKAGMYIAKFRKKKYLENLRVTGAGEKAPTGNIGVGFMASGPKETTYGQVTDLPIQFSEEELLCSWFGGALGIGFGGGFDFLSAEPELIRFIYSGWQYYRKLIEETPNLKGRQIETWNGLWLLHGLEHRNDTLKAYDALSQKVGTALDASKDVVKLKRPEWSDQILVLANAFGGDEPLTLHGYSFGSTNKTLGYMLVQIPKVRKFSQLFDHFVAQETEIKSMTLQEVFKAHYSMQLAARYGSLGLRALTPKDIPKHLGRDAPTISSLQKEFQKNPYQFIIYKSWIIAMLNNEELHELAEKLAKELLDYKNRGKDSFSTAGDKSKNIERIWEKRYPAFFIHRLSDIVDEIPQPSETFKDVSKAVANKMTPDQFQLFQSLLRFEYTYSIRKETIES